MTQTKSEEWVFQEDKAGEDTRHCARVCKWMAIESKHGAHASLWWWREMILDGEMGCWAPRGQFLIAFASISHVEDALSSRQDLPRGWLLQSIQTWKQIHEWISKHLKKVSEIAFLLLFSLTICNLVESLLDVILGLRDRIQVPFVSSEQLSFRVGC